MGSFTLLFSACQKRFYQVYEVASEQLDHKKDALVFENSEVKVRYNLWSQQGELAFVIENKTDEDLFIDLSRSFLIKNGEAMDYYEDLQQSTQTTRSATTSVGGLVSNLPLFLGKENKTSTSQTTLVKEKPIVCIPAHSWKYLNKFSLAPSLFITCSARVNLPSQYALVESYEKSNSPWIYQNHISYSTKEDLSERKSIKNSFWITSIHNYPQSKILKKRKVKECNQTSFQEEFTIAQPNRFYISYAPEAVWDYK